jgi:hypothetical protein
VVACARARSKNIGAFFALEWGISWNAPLPSGGNALGNQVTLTISLSLVAED